MWISKKEGNGNRGSKEGDTDEDADRRGLGRVAGARNSGKISLMEFKVPSVVRVADDEWDEGVGDGEGSAPSVARVADDKGVGDNDGEHVIYGRVMDNADSTGVTCDV